MRELNEQELEQVAGGSGFTFTYIANELATGGAVAGQGLAYTKNFVSSTHGPDFSSSIAASKSFAFGTTAAVQSESISNSSVTIASN